MTETVEFKANLEVFVSCCESDVWKGKKYKAHILKYVPCILKYMACVFYNMPYVFYGITKTEICELILLAQTGRNYNS